ncbi:MAG TPA: acyl-CoA dehydrogenase family protein, partial [Candidatus Dormibacteraeota bacterium]|nr:acyl-CoA dehydrogenase family protein [Candidatus Dormibacteraeota bacterium]
MDFGFTPEQLEIRTMLRRLVTERIAPRAAEIDRNSEYPSDLERLLAENGVLAIPVPQQYGGVSGSAVTTCMAVEELAKACATTSLILSVQALGAHPILLAGTEEQKMRLCPGIASGETMAAYALSEPGAGSDAGALTTRAVRDGDDYVITGTKTFISGGSEADLMVVFARTQPDGGTRGISAFVLEREESPWTVLRLEHKMGIRGSPTAQIGFDEVRVPARNRLGGEGEGFKIALAVLDRSRPSIGAQALGIAEGALELAAGYAGEREQFGKPIASFQGIEFMLADMATQIEA